MNFSLAYPFQSLFLSLSLSLFLSLSLSLLPFSLPLPLPPLSPSLSLWLSCSFLFLLVLFLLCCYSSLVLMNYKVPIIGKFTPTRAVLPIIKYTVTLKDFFSECVNNLTYPLAVRVVLGGHHR